MNPPAQAPTQGAAPRGQGPHTADPARAEIDVLEARLAPLRGPSVPQLSLGESSPPLGLGTRPWCTSPAARVWEPVEHSGYVYIALGPVLLTQR